MKQDAPSEGALLRVQAHAILTAALEAVDPATAVRAHLALDGDILIVGGAGNAPVHTVDLRHCERVFIVGGGKAGAPMASAAVEILGARVTTGTVVVKHGHNGPEERQRAAERGVDILEAGHPIPDAAGYQAAQRIAALLRQAGPRDLVLCLLSGGGSALLTLPVVGVNLHDLQEITRVLLACGATINEINTIRKHLSQLKGGQMARLAAPAKLVTLILSDVVGDPLDVIASGPTVADTTTFGDAWQIVHRYGIECQLPPSVVSHLQRGLRGDVPETPKAGDEAFDGVINRVIGSNRLACQAAARQARDMGFNAGVLTTFLEGEAREVGKMAAGLAKGLARGETCCPWPERLGLPAGLILGGETTVTLRGDGKGGRNTEAALAAAVALDGWEHVLVAFLATDGNDGPTDAAGAFADGSTLARALQMGLDAADYLRRNDSYTFFERLNNLILTGPTQTNVNDLVLVLAGKP